MNAPHHLVYMESVKTSSTATSVSARLATPTTIAPPKSTSASPIRASTVQNARTRSTLTSASVLQATQEPTVKQISMSVSQIHVRMVRVRTV